MFEKNAKAKKYLIFIVIILILASIFLFNLIRQNKTANYSDKAIKNNISTISSFDYSKVSTVENQVKALGSSSNANSYNSNGSMTRAQYQKIFNTSIVIGDSITEGLVDFGYLNSSEVVCKIGSSVMKGDDLFASAAGSYPKYAFFAFGMNDMGNYNGNSKRFVEKYSSLLKDFKKKSPDSKIFINSISKPSSAAIRKNSSLKNYKKFNSAMEEMCTKLNITYIDNTYILEEHPGYYESDGIHVSPGYYDKWLSNMMLKARL